MAYLLIEDVGPITKRTKINLRRFNVFIGPQSSGKSTIAKILSTCTWLEKESIVTLSKDIVPNNDFKTMLEDYHRMHGYIHESSVIEYDSPYIHMEYNKGDFSIQLKDWQSYKRVKSTYIPSDRNVVVMPDIEKRNMENTDFRSFMFDWLMAHKAFDTNHRLNLLDLNVQYYFDENAKFNQDTITHSNGKTYSIPLYDASSGLQSVVPLFGMTSYLADQYFKDYDRVSSFDEDSKRRSLVVSLVDRLLRPLVVANEDMSAREIMDYIETQVERGNNNAKIEQRFFVNVFNNLAIPQTIHYVIEELEQNIFPATQVRLVNSLIALCNLKREHSATLTTHSPYILAAINILIFAGRMVEDGIDPSIIENIVPIESMISPSEIGVYTMENGGVRSIIDKKTGLINQNDLDTASEYNAGIFDKLFNIYIKSKKK